MSSRTWSSRSGTSELPFFRAIAYDILRAVPKDDPNYIRCGRLLKILHYMLPVDLSVMNEIPPLSILREFIGGSDYKY